MAYPQWWRLKKSLHHCSPTKMSRWPIRRQRIAKGELQTGFRSLVFHWWRPILHPSTSSSGFGDSINIWIHFSAQYRPATTEKRGTNIHPHHHNPSDYRPALRQSHQFPQLPLPHVPPSWWPYAGTHQNMAAPIFIDTLATDSHVRHRQSKPCCLWWSRLGTPLHPSV